MNKLNKLKKNRSISHDRTLVNMTQSHKLIKQSSKTIIITLLIQYKSHYLFTLVVPPVVL